LTEEVTAGKAAQVEPTLVDVDDRASSHHHECLVVSGDVESS
jgi:hypothetical protein